MGVSTSTPVNFNYDQQLLADTKVQSVEADVEEVKGETKPRRHPVAKEKLLVEAYVDEKTGEGAKTVWDCFQRGVKLNGDGPFLGTRVYEVDEKNQVIFDKDKTPKRGEYVWLTYNQVDREARDFGAGLTLLGAKAGDNLGIFSNNRTEWVESSLAFYSQNMRTVSLYATLGEDAVEFIINHADIKICMVSQENMSNLLKSLGKVHLTHIIQFDVDTRYKNYNETISEEHRKKAAEHNVTILGFTEVQKMAADKGIFPNPPKADDLAMVMYTSGTTGNPKGALLSHKNIVAAVAGTPYIVPIDKNDRHISYLPLAHIFETVIQCSAYAVGAQIGFFQNNVKKLTADFQALKPTILCGVPRVFSRIYQTVFAGVAAKNCVVKWYFNKAYQYQCEQIRAGRPRYAKYDQKVFIPLRERVGLEQCRVIITGAAPCPPYLIEFLKVVIGADVCQGYGLTETCAAGSIVNPGDTTVGHCGPPTPSCEVKLVDIPDMEYHSTDKPYPRGEVLIRGANVFLGYYKDEKNTEGALKDGWLCTGDVGRWNPNGTLSIIDRKKNMFKLSQGEYIAAEKIETTYGKAPLAGQVFVYGNSFKSTLIAVVVPAMEPTFNFFVEKGWWPVPKEQTPLGSEEFLKHFHEAGEAHKAELKAFVLASLREQEKPLKGFEKLADIIIETRIDKTGAGFTEANGCMTPTFKLRRPYLLKRYLNELKAAYGAVGEPVAADEKWPGEE